MKALIKTPVIVALSLAMLTATSCKKRDTAVADQDLPEAPNTESSSDNSKADEMQTHVYTVVHTEVSNVEEQSFKTDGVTVPGDDCASVYVSLDTITYNAAQYIYVDSLIIDYGYGNNCNWGERKKEGKIIVTKNLKMSTPTSMTTVQLDSFYVDGYRLKGTATLENKGFNLNELTLKVTVNGGQIISPDKSQVSSFSTDRTIKIEYYPTKVFMKMYGTNNGVNHLGQSYTATVLESEPLFFVYGCKYPQKGIVTITSTIAGGSTLKVDFSGGTGGCDNLAVVTLNGTKYKQTLGF